jgi:hypothetical protein
MTRAQGIVKEVSVRIVCIAVATVSLYACSQTAPPTAMNNTTFTDTAQHADMAEVVISTSRGPSRPTH